MDITTEWLTRLGLDEEIGGYRACKLLISRRDGADWKAWFGGHAILTLDNRMAVLCLLGLLKIDVTAPSRSSQINEIATQAVERCR